MPMPGRQRPDLTPTLQAPTVRVHPMHAWINLTAGANDGTYTYSANRSPGDPEWSARGFVFCTAVVQSRRLSVPGELCCTFAATNPVRANGQNSVDVEPARGTNEPVGSSIQNPVGGTWVQCL